MCTRPAIIGRVSLTGGKNAAWLGLVAACALTARARADDAARELPAPRLSDAVYLAIADDAAGRTQAEQAAHAFARERGFALTTLEQPLGEAPRAESPQSALRVLTHVEDALGEARELSARLREASALRVLAEAEQALLGALDVPFAQAFLAEVYLQMALCAAQLGELSLFDSRLAEALSLDPRRHVEAAEAPPAVVARADGLSLANDRLPLSETPVRPEPREAAVWLDGSYLGAGEVVLRARQGAHVLVVRAKGYAPYAALVKLQAGARPALRVRLSPLPAEQLRERLLRAAAEGRVDRAGAVQLAALIERPVVIVQDGHSGHALISLCDAKSCRPVVGGAGRGVSAGGAEASAWLADPSRRAEPARVPRRWRRWAMWVSGAVVLGAGCALVAWSQLRREEQKERELVIDPPVAGMTNTWRTK